jgi:hypothetical protein
LGAQSPGKQVQTMWQNPPVSKSKFVIPSRRLLYRVIGCYTESSFVIPSRRLLYRVVVCYTESSCVIPSRGLLYRFVVCYTGSSSVIPSRRLLYRVVVVMCICPSPLEVKLRLECVRCFFLETENNIRNSGSN